MEHDVVIPTVGRDSLRRAVTSALSQSLPVRVTVVLDDPSRIAVTEELLDGLAVELLVNETPRGGARSRNRGLDAGAAPAVAFLDDDDWWHPAYLASRLAARPSPASREGADDGGRWLVLGAFTFVAADGSTRAVPRHRAPVDSPAQLGSYAVTRSSTRFGSHAVQTSSLVLSRELAELLRWREDLRKHQDWDLVLRAGTVPGVRAGWDPEPLAFVVQDSPSSVSRRRDWTASYEWWSRVRPDLSPRASADFLAALVLRSALAQREWRALPRVVRSFPAFPHPAALAVGALGAVGR